MSVKKIIGANFDFSSRLRTKIKQNDLVTVNGGHFPMWVSPSAGDVICITLPPENSDFEPFPLDLDVIYEDEDLLAVDKPAGLVVHPTYGFTEKTLAHALSYMMERTGERFKIRFINRLDMDTSGILLVAKNAYVQDRAARFQERGLVKKSYTAFVSNVPYPPEGLIDAPVGRPDPEGPRRGVVEWGKPSKTVYRVLETFAGGAFSMVELGLLTGRTHQIRVHMGHIGCPLLGDGFYGGDTRMIKRQALHAKSLSLPHPVTEEPLDLACPLPADLAGLLSRLRSL